MTVGAVTQNRMQHLLNKAVNVTMSYLLERIQGTEQNGVPLSTLRQYQSVTLCVSQITYGMNALCKPTAALDVCLLGRPQTSALFDSQSLLTAAHTLQALLITVRLYCCISRKMYFYKSYLIVLHLSVIHNLKSSRDLHK
jgi:hypothetical protein